MKKTLTVFTPTYNRAHTIGRTYESLCRQTCKDFEWLIVNDGSVDDTREVVHKWIDEKILPIKYFEKENGGLHTGYNMAIANINTELCVCIDADDYMPDDAVETILGVWKERASSRVAGIIGLDYIAGTDKPIGGFFSDTDGTYHFTELSHKLRHHGDTKMVLCTELLKPFVPMRSFPDEKNFNPIYLYLKINPKLEYILINKNLCFVDYQDNGMSANIIQQFYNSPRSFAEIRKAKLEHPRISLRRKYIDAAHLVSCAFIAKDMSVATSSPMKLLTLLATPLGIIFYIYIILNKSKK